ncbi:MAG: hypothetical protein ABI314_07875 [Gemmatimonadaceae bacterium]
MVAPDVDASGAPVAPTAPASGPAAAPQWWQNLEPGVSVSPHVLQGAPFRGVPHSVQKRPVPIAEQRGQTVEVGSG